MLQLTVYEISWSNGFLRGQNTGTLPIFGCGIWRPTGVLPQKCEEDTPETTTVTTMQRFTPIVTLLLIDQPKRNKE